MRIGNALGGFAYGSIVPGQIMACQATPGKWHRQHAGIALNWIPEVDVARSLPSGRLDEELQRRRAGATLEGMRLLECFAPLFSYGLFLDEQVDPFARPESVADAHAHARQLVELARQAALTTGKPQAQIEMAAFAAVAWFDEMMARHEGGRDPAESLQLSLFRTSSAATEFFDHLASLGSETEAVREVYAMALLLGFTGQYYYEQGDSGELGRIKALHCRPSVTADAVLQTLQREPITPQPYQVPSTPVSPLQVPWVSRRTAPLVACVLVVLVLVAFVGPAFSLSIPAQVWSWAGVAVAVAGAFAWLGALGWHHLVLRRAHTRVAEHPDAGYGIGDMWTVLADALRHARGALLHPFRRRGEWRRMSRHPWLLFAGDSAGQVRNLLQAAAKAPHARALAGDDAARPWHWWLYRAVVAVEPGGSLVRAPEPPRAPDSPWRRALALLARERRKLPLDGIVVCVGADHLLEPIPAHESPAQRLYDMVDEAVQTLHLQLPLYVVVTGLESLPGYGAFRQTLPAAALRRALGWRVAPSRLDSAAGGRLPVLVGGTMERLRVVATAALAERRDPHGRRQAFEFLWSLYGLQDGLELFLSQLLSGPSIAGRRLHWCGTYFTAGPQNEAPGGDFVEDLFQRFLPGDWPLARRVADTDNAEKN